MFLFSIHLLAILFVCHFYDALPHPVPNPFPFPEGPLRTELAVPGLSAMKISLPKLKDVKYMIGGWGIFNLGADASKIIFTLNNKKGNYKDYVLHPDSPSNLKKSKWDKSQNTIIMIHGYTEDGGSGPFARTKKINNAYVEMKRPENLVFVDWSVLGRQLNYFKSASNTGKAGLRIAEFIMALLKEGYIQSLKKVHIIGFSLGAHCAGIAAYYCYKIGKKEKIGWVTGIDPAGPGFINAPLESRLDPEDAAFVDVIHTNMGPIITTFGIPFASGHVDFYPNGGENQPGCKLPFVGEIVGVCSHLRAVDYYASTITGAKVYKACPCESYKKFKTGACDCKDGVAMGDFVDSKARGKYYIDIPLDKNQKRETYINDDERYLALIMASEYSNMI